MTVSLRSALRDLLADWRNDLTSEWQAVLDGIEPDFEAIDTGLELHAWEPIFPSRRHFRLPGAPEGAHLFRAFDDIGPQDVRCLLLGQDPYPSISFSTGRSFEDGEHRHWSEMNSMRSNSMRSLIQSIYAYRTGQPTYARGIDAWPRTLRAIENRANGFPGPSELAQTWVDQGVLLLNASLTLSRFSVQGDPHQVNGHLRLWKPVIVRLLRYFVDQPVRPVVFILMGDAARQAGTEAGLLVPEDAEEGNSLGNRIITTPHPASGNDFLSGTNPFALCNQTLDSMNEPPICW